MAQANKRPDKTHNKLIKEPDRLKTYLNDKGSTDIDLDKRQLRSRMIVAPTPRVFNVSQMTIVDTIDPHSKTTQVEEVQTSP